MVKRAKPTKCIWCSALVVLAVVIHGHVLLMMGIMMPETCCDRSLLINIGLVASCWFISLFTVGSMTHGHKKLKLKKKVPNF